MDVQSYLKSATDEELLRLQEWSPTGKARGTIIGPASPLATPWHPPTQLWRHLAEAKFRLPPRAKPVVPGEGGWLTTELKSRTSKPPKTHRVKTYSDGASRGNPGHAGIGALLYDENGNKIVQDYRYIGIGTNNEAEYRALLLALDHASDLTKGHVDCYMDSELLVKQLNGEYAIKSEKLVKFYLEVKHRIRKFQTVRFTHHPRTHPMLRLADKLANKAIDEARPTSSS